MTAAVHSIRREASDTDLISAIAAGDRSALGALFDRYEPELRRYFGRMGANASDADDLVQATFLQIARAAVRFDITSPARGWIYGVATMILRRHRRLLGSLAAKLFAWRHVARVTHTSAPPDENVELDRMLDKLSQALERMAPKKREVFVLVALEGLSGNDVAKALDVPINTIWTRLHHARRELRAALEGDEP